MTRHQTSAAPIDRASRNTTAGIGRRAEGRAMSGNVSFVLAAFLAAACVPALCEGM
jgi:hypothetical protein